MSEVDAIILADNYMIIIGISLFFTAVAMVRRTIILELLATLCWWVSAIIHLIAAPSALYAISWLWLGFGIIFFLVFWFDIWQIFIVRKKQKWDDIL